MKEVECVVIDELDRQRLILIHCPDLIGFASFPFHSIEEIFFFLSFSQCNDLFVYGVRKRTGNGKRERLGEQMFGTEQKHQSIRPFDKLSRFPPADHAGHFVAKLPATDGKISGVRNSVLRNSTSIRKMLSCVCCIKVERAT